MKYDVNYTHRCKWRVEVFDSIDEAIEFARLHGGAIYSNDECEFLSDSLEGFPHAAAVSRYGYTPVVVPERFQRPEAVQ